MTVARQRFGAAGERRAERWYIANGYEFVARNWRCKDGEIDLIFRRDRTLVFVEVKARRSDAYGHPSEAVTPVKQARIRRVARQFCQVENIRARHQRFDVVAILAGQIEVITDAF